MRVSFFLHVGVTCSLVASTALASARLDHPPEDVNYVSGDIGQRIAGFVEAVEMEGFTGAVIAARDGEVIAAVAVGSADLGGDQPNTPATLFEIASASKQFTAAAVMRLVQDGKLRLDDPIARHLPGVPENCAEITIEHLLRHTSGIPGSNAQGGGDDLERVVSSFLRGGPAHTPGTHWEYWNQGYALLSEIIARASDQPYTEYLRESLFRSAGLTVTCFTGDEAPPGTTVSVGRSAYGEPRSALDHPYGSYGFQYRGMGGVVTSVWDLWRWDRALHGDAVLGKQAKAQLFEPGLNDYALGWFVRRDGSGRLVHSHGGAVRGFICEIRRYPEQDAFLAVLCNRDDVPLHRVVQSVEELLFEQPLSGPAPLQGLDAEVAAALAGRYEGGHGRVLVIRAEGQTARAEIHWSPSGPVTRATLGLDDRGRVLINDGSPEPVALQFDRAEHGSVRTVSILGDRYTRIADEGGAAEEATPGKAHLPIDPGMNVMIATKPYRLNEHGLAHLPAAARWRVLPRYVGVDEAGAQTTDDRMTLVLMDQEHSFWPVIARMDLEVAEELVRQLEAEIARRRGAE